MCALTLAVTATQLKYINVLEDGVREKDCSYYIYYNSIETDSPSCFAFISMVPLLDFVFVQFSTERQPISISDHKAAIILKRFLT